MTATCSCHKQCAGGDKCGCNGAVPHTLHICRNPHCECHRAAGYGLVKTVLRNGNEVYAEGAPSLPAGLRVLEVHL